MFCFFFGLFFAPHPKQGLSYPVNVDHMWQCGDACLEAVTPRIRFPSGLVKKPSGSMVIGFGANGFFGSFLVTFLTQKVQKNWNHASGHFRDVLAMLAFFFSVYTGHSPHSKNFHVMLIEDWRLPIIVTMTVNACLITWPAILLVIKVSMDMRQLTRNLNEDMQFGIWMDENL